jgi:hypothetical protein
VFVRRLVLAVLGVTAAGCGDNARACGPGTQVDEHGFCVAVAPDGGTPCGAGTQLDPITHTCVVGPGVCPEGTILIADRCADPHGNLAVDLEEAPEPNGLGVIEASLAPAGIVALPVEGAPGFVIHGVLQPVADVNHDMQLDPDVDTYEIYVGEPALLHVTVAGVGVIGGFIARGATGEAAPIPSWQRFGLTASTSTAMRQIYLPRSGNYLLAIADSRTLFQYSTGGPAAAAPGPGDYYVTIDHLALGALTPLGGAYTGAIAADARADLFATTATPIGLTLAMPSPQLRSAVVIATPDASIVQLAMAPSAGATLDVIPSGFPSGPTLVVVDPLYDTATAAMTYTLTPTF